VIGPDCQGRALAAIALKPKTIEINTVFHIVRIGHLLV
jgi:hypothetical protein